MNQSNSYRSEHRLLKSREELIHVLQLSSNSHLLGDKEDDVHQYFLFDIYSADSMVARIGILSYCVGLKPNCLFRENKLLVGFNQSVAIFCLERFYCQNQIDLLSLFYEFIEFGKESPICVLCETAVVAIANDNIKWRVDTDLITNHKMCNDIIELEFLDDHPCRINLLSGLEVK